MSLVFFLGCQPPKSTLPPLARELGLPSRSERPSAYENGKFFERDGRKWLYGGKAEQSHFDVTNCSLRDEQFHYGIGREAFPALLEPEFTDVVSAGEIWSDEDRFLVAFSGQEVKAYGIKDLIRHEIVNDELNGKPIMAAYCILADLGAIYERRYGEETLTFALSGYTYYDDDVWDGMDGFVFWDRETESLWWPLIGKAVSGPLKGVGLQLMDKAQWRDTDWATVKREFPRAKVLRSGLDFVRPDSWRKIREVEKIVEQY